MESFTPLDKGMVVKGSSRIKQLYRKPGGKLIIRSYNNEAYPDEEADIDDVEIIGRLFWYSVLL
jgi:phage repressor protein C with HTH and peptisase S24 domain